MESQLEEGWYLRFLSGIGSTLDFDFVYVYPGKSLNCISSTEGHFALEGSEDRSDPRKLLTLGRPFSDGPEIFLRAYAKGLKAEAEKIPAADQYSYRDCRKKDLLRLASFLERRLDFPIHGGAVPEFS